MMQKKEKSGGTRPFWSFVQIEGLSGHSCYVTLARGTRSLKLTLSRTCFDARCTLNGTTLPPQSDQPGRCWKQAAATDLYGSLSLSIASDLASQLLVSFHVRQSDELNAELWLSMCLFRAFSLSSSNSAEDSMPDALISSI